MLGYWHYLLSGATGLGLFLSIVLANQTANAQLGWDINTNLSKQQISVVTTTHQHPDETSTCVLWIKKGSKVLLIGSMPETGKKTFNINEKTLAMFKGGEIIISFENKKNLIPPPLNPLLLITKGNGLFK